MAIARLEKVSIYTIKHQVESLVGFLQSFGDFEIVNNNLNLDKNKNNLEDKIKLMRLNLEKANYLYHFFIKTLSTEKEPYKDEIIEVKQNIIDNTINNFSLENIYTVIKDRESSINNNRIEIVEALSTIDLLRPFEKLDIPLEKLKSSEHTDVSVCKIQKNLLVKVFSELPVRSYYNKFNEIGNYAYFYVVSLKELKHDVEKIFSKNNIEIIKLPEVENKKTASIEIRLLIDKINVAKSRIEENHAYCLKVAKKNIDDIKIFIDEINSTIERLGILEDIKTSSFTVCISGWTLSNRLNDLEAGLEKALKNQFYITHDESKLEDIPVVLKNNRFFRAFENITKLYGLPKQSEVDPSAFLSVWFLVFFGFCITDAGYGIIMIAIAIYLYFNKKLISNLDNRSMVDLLFLGGIFTLVMGSLFNSWFGVTLDPKDPTNPLALEVFFNQHLDLNLLQWAWYNFMDFAKSLQVFDVIKDPLSILIFSLVLGSLHIVWGMFVRGFSIWKNGHNIWQKLDSFLASLPWSITILSALFFAFSSFNKLPLVLGLNLNQYSQISKYTLISALIFVFLTEGRHEKGIVNKFVGGLVGWYSIIGYLSDILSYSRLLALGLTTGIVAMAMNKIAGLVFDIPYIGFILGIFVLILGHVFNIVLNAIGGYIHSARLQFVEFFKLFMEGGGKTFNPMKKNRIFTKII